MRPRRTYLTLGGVERSVTEWSKRTGLKPVTIHMRLRAGWSIVDTLTTAPTVADTLTHEGTTLTFKAWSLRTGIPSDAIRMRITSLGWSVADALTVPVGSRQRRRKRGVASNFVDVPATDAPSNARDFSQLEISE